MTMRKRLLWITFLMGLVGAAGVGRLVFAVFWSGETLIDERIEAKPLKRSRKGTLSRREPVVHRYSLALDPAMNPIRGSVSVWGEATLRLIDPGGCVLHDHRYVKDMEGRYSVVHVKPFTVDAAGIHQVEFVVSPFQEAGFELRRNGIVVSTECMVGSFLTLMIGAVSFILIMTWVALSSWGAKRRAIAADRSA